MHTVEATGNRIAVDGLFDFAELPHGFHMRWHDALAYITTT